MGTEGIWVPLLIGAVATTGGLSIMAQRQAGKDAKAASEAEAANLQIQAENARLAAEEEAKNRQDEGRHFLATQQAESAAGNIKINVGAPLVIAADTRNILAREKGYILKRGRDEAASLNYQARMALAVGKNAKRNANMGAIATGVGTGASIGAIGYSAGWWGNKGGSSPFSPQSNAKISNWMNTP